MKSAGLEHCTSGLLAEKRSLEQEFSQLSQKFSLLLNEKNELEQRFTQMEHQLEGRTPVHNRLEAEQAKCTRLGEELSCTRKEKVLHEKENRKLKRLLQEKEESSSDLVSRIKELENECNCKLFII